ncbi:hypothetical protein [Thermoflexus sp.]|nr:hypothetical protein [Thermoflexus sp.]
MEELMALYLGSTIAAIMVIIITSLFGATISGVLSLITRPERRRYE